MPRRLLIFPCETVQSLLAVLPRHQDQLAPTPEKGAKQGRRLVLQGKEVGEFTRQNHASAPFHLLSCYAAAGGFIIVSILQKVLPRKAFSKKDGNWPNFAKIFRILAEMEEKVPVSSSQRVFFLPFRAGKGGENMLQ